MVYLFNAIRNRTINQRRNNEKTVSIEEVTYREKTQEVNDSLMMDEIENKLRKMDIFHQKLFDAYCNDKISMNTLCCGRHRVIQLDVTPSTFVKNQ